MQQSKTAIVFAVLCGPAELHDASGTLSIWCLTCYTTDFIVGWDAAAKCLKVMQKDSVSWLPFKVRAEADEPKTTQECCSGIGA